MKPEPVNPNAGPDWSPALVRVTRGRLGILDVEPFAAMARGEWAVMPDGEETGFPVSVIHLATGAQLAAVRNGAAGMRLADQVAAHWPGLFGADVEPDQETLFAVADFVEAAGAKIVAG